MFVTFMPPTFRTLNEMAQTSFERYATRPAYGTKRNGTWSWTSYGEIAKLVARCRGGLVSLGVRPGDRVAIISDNCLEWPVACYGTYGAGAVFVPMYEAQLAKEWRFILRDCGAKVAILRTPAAYETLEALRSELPELQHVFGLHLPADSPHSFDSLLRRGDEHPAPVQPVEPSSLAGIIYTSGTTGTPKGVVLSHGNIASNVSALHQVFLLQPEDRTLAFLPWAHAYGQTCEVHVLMSMGASAAINDDIANLIHNLQEVKPTLLLAVPRVFNKLYGTVQMQLARKPRVIRKLFKDGLAAALRQRTGAHLSPIETATLRLADKLVFSKIRTRFGGRLKYAISASAALSRDVAEFIDAVGVPFYEGYGLTETSPIVSTNSPTARKIGSVGKPLPGIRIVIDEQRGDGVPGHGEIIVYGPNVMVDYWYRPEETEKVRLADGGLRTGDIGYMDAEGFLYITGRIKEQFKLENGKYVMPGPLEDQLKLSPYISTVMLYGANRPYTVALVAVDAAAIKQWAHGEGIALDDVESDRRVHDLIRREAQRYATEFKPYERPMKFVLTAREFTTDNGMLTPTLKLKRRNVVAEFGPRLDALYAADAKEAAAE